MFYRNHGGGGGIKAPKPSVHFKRTEPDRVKLSILYTILQYTSLVFHEVVQTEIKKKTVE